MHKLDILFPVFALASWTGLVLLLVPFMRVRSALRRELVADDFKFGESGAVPPYVSIPNRNYMNLLEMPVLFYVACLLLYVIPGTSSLAMAVPVAWAFVMLRVVHSAIHLTYNRVLHRLAAFALSNLVLIVLWVLAAIHITGTPIPQVPSPFFENSGNSGAYQRELWRASRLGQACSISFMVGRLNILMH